LTIFNTKEGRERSGHNERIQLQRELYEAEVDALSAGDDLPPFEPDRDRPFLADELPDSG
jgi:hypothetical protein